VAHRPVGEQAFFDGAGDEALDPDVAVALGDALVGGLDGGPGAFEELEVEVVAADQGGGEGVGRVAAAAVAEDGIRAGIVEAEGPGGVDQLDQVQRRTPWCRCNAPRRPASPIPPRPSTALPCHDGTEVPVGPPGG